MPSPDLAPWPASRSEEELLEVVRLRARQLHRRRVVPLAVVATCSVVVAALSVPALVRGGGGEVDLSTAGEPTAGSLPARTDEPARTEERGRDEGGQDAPRRGEERGVGSPRTYGPAAGNGGQEQHSDIEQREAVTQIVTDPEGDAAGTLGASQAAIDITAVEIGAVEGSLVFALRVADLDAPVPEETYRLSYSIYFRHAGRRLGVEAGRAPDGSNETFEAGNDHVYLQISGWFDERSDTVVLVLPLEPLNRELENAEPSAEPVREGSVLTDFEVVTVAARVLPGAPTDTAAGAVAYRVQQG